MNIEINRFLRHDKATKKGTPICFSFSINNEQFKVWAREYVPDGAKWDDNRGIIDNKYKNATVINNRINADEAMLLRIIESAPVFEINLIQELYKQYKKDGGEFSPKQAIEKKQEECPEDYNFQAKWTKAQKEKFLGYSKEARQFYGLIETILHEHRNEWSEGHQKKFRTIRNKIIGNLHDPNNTGGKNKVAAFDPTFEPRKFSLGWWQNYVDHCFEELENEHNTIQTDLKAFRQLCTKLRARGIKFNENFMSAKMEYIEPRIEPLEWSEVQAIKNLDMSDPARNIRATLADSQFVWVAAAMIGQRWKDIKRVGPNSFNQRNVIKSDGTTKKQWFYSNRQQKTKKLIEIPLTDEAVAWLKLRKFNMPDVTNQTVNRDIKDLARMAGLTAIVRRDVVIKGEVKTIEIPKYKTVHVHTARHSYAVLMVTKALKKGMAYALKFVSEMLGHASPQTTWKYINLVSSEKDAMFISIIDDLDQPEPKAVMESIAA